MSGSPPAARRILVVDDDPRCRAAMAWLLSEEGYETLEAADGDEASELLLSWRPDLVVTDLDMPRLDGRGLLKRIHGLRRRVPVLVLTARDEADVEAQSDGCFSKPVRIDDLIARIRELIGSGASSAESVTRGSFSVAVSSTRD
jgi:two-component system KDP operon response regulator KdpE